MKDPRFLRRALAAGLLVAALGAVGCSKDDNKTTNPPGGGGGSIGQVVADDIAVTTAAVLQPTALDLTTAMAGTDTSSFLGVGIPFGTTTADTTFTRGPFTVHVTRTFFDSGNVQLAVYDSTATHMVWTSQITGGRVTAVDSTHFGHSSVFTFSGLQDTVVTWTGGALDTLFSRFRKLNGDTLRYVYAVSSMTVNNVVLPRAGDGLYPLSGTLTYVIHADRLRSPSRTDLLQRVNATVVVTFNGTSTASILVNNTYRYNWNLLTNVIVRA